MCRHSLLFSVMLLGLEYNMLLLGYYKRIKKCGVLCPVLSPSPLPLFLLLVFIYFYLQYFQVPSQFIQSLTRSEALITFWHITVPLIKFQLSVTLQNDRHMFEYCFTFWVLWVLTTQLVKYLVLYND